jgi:hypothetical protein
MRKFFGREHHDNTTGPKPEAVEATLVDYGSPELLARLAHRLTQGIVETPLLLQKVIEHGNPPADGPGPGHIPGVDSVVIIDLNTINRT